MLHDFANMGLADKSRAVVIRPSPTELLMNWMRGEELKLGCPSKIPVSFCPMLIVPYDSVLTDLGAVLTREGVGVGTLELGVGVGHGVYVGLGVYVGTTAGVGRGVDDSVAAGVSVG